MIFILSDRKVNLKTYDPQFFGSGYFKRHDHFTSHRQETVLGGRLPASNTGRTEGNTVLTAIVRNVVPQADLKRKSGRIWLVVLVEENVSTCRRDCCCEEDWLLRVEQMM